MFPDHVWRAFEATFASDNHGVLDARHCAENFRNGYGMAIYWETLARWIATRARRDARVLQVPLVFLQSADECSTLDREAAARLLTVANIHHTGHMHGVLLAHVGMRVRLTAKFNATLGLVQEQKATIVDFIFHDVDAEAYRAARPGCVFRPKMLPAAIVLKVDGFKECPVASGLQMYALQVDTASSIFFLEPTEQTFTWRARRRIMCDAWASN